jgi:hypothetical protein
MPGRGISRGIRPIPFKDACFGDVREADSNIFELGIFFTGGIL